MEKTAIETGTRFTWSQNEPLTDLEKPERMLQIKKDFKYTIMYHLYPWKGPFDRSYSEDVYVVCFYSEKTSHGRSIQLQQGLKHK